MIEKQREILFRKKSFCIVMSSKLPVICQKKFSTYSRSYHFNNPS